MRIRSEALAVSLAGLAALAVAMGVGRFAFTPLLPMMNADHGLSLAQGGWLASANYFGYLVGGLSAIWLRLGARTAIGASLALIVVTTLGMALSTNVLAWAALRAVAGIASAWVLVFVSAWCLERLGVLGKPRLGSVVFAGVGAGIALAGGVCLVLMRNEVSSTGAWLALGAVSIALCALTWPIFAGRPAGRSMERPPGRFRWNRDTSMLVACYGVFGFGYIIPATFVPAMAKQVIADPAVFGWSWPLFGLAALLSTLAAAGWIAALGNRRIWILGVLVMAAGVIAPVLSRGLPAILFSAVCVGGTFMVVTMAGLQEARRLAGTHGRTLMAAMTSSFAAGQIAGPLAVSWLSASAHGIDAALVVAAAFLVCSAIALALPMTPERKPIEAVPE